MKGIILAGGTGSRLYPLTISCSKQLLPIFDKPLIYYPLTTLINIGVDDILIICRKIDLRSFKDLLGNGKEFGIKIIYKIQDKPKGIAEAFIIGKEFIKKENVALILGDNIFHGLNYDKVSNFYNKIGATIFTYNVPDPENYGVAYYKDNLVHKIIEKPKTPKSNSIVTGLYLYDNDIINISKGIKPSKRNELEISEVNNLYIRNKKMHSIKLQEGAIWIDAGNPESLFRASEYIKIVQERQNILIGSPHMSSYRRGLISRKKIIDFSKKFKDTVYQKQILLLL